MSSVEKQQLYQEEKLQTLCSRDAWVRFMDPVVEQMQYQTKNVSAKSATKSAYIRLAHVWLELAANELYRKRQNQLAVGVTELLQGHIPGTMLSLGAGDGYLDAEILKNLSRNTQYVPTDISSTLLSVAHRYVGNVATIPFDILGDFENNLKLIFDVADALSGPRLWTMTGNTFTNLYDGEGSFLEKYRDLANAEDMLLIGVRIHHADWVMEDDSWFDVKRYTPEMRQFICAAAACVLGKIPSWKHVFAQKREHRADGAGAWEVFVSNGSQSIVVLRTVRYERAGLHQLCEKSGFEILGSQAVDLEDNSLKISDYLLLLKKVS